MDLQTKKIKFIQEVLRINSKEILDKLERILYQERKKRLDKEYSSMSLEEFNSRIDAAEEDSISDKMYNAGDILKDIDSWK